MTKNRYTVSIAPYAGSGRTVRAMVMTTIACLTPAALFGLFQFGLSAAILLACGVFAALITELIVGKIVGRPETVKNGHAVLVGLMLAMMLPSGAPFWLVIIGASLGILIGKLPFGPLGGSPISPVLIGLLIVTLSWPNEVKNFEEPSIVSEHASKQVTAENPAPAEDPQLAASVDPSDIPEYSTLDLLLGHYPGFIGTVSPLFCLIGGLLLIGFKVGRWEGALAYLIGIAVFGAAANAICPENCPDAVFQLLTGASVFAAFFLCTEWSSTPVTQKGLLLFGLLAGGLTILFRVTGMPVGSEAYAIAICSLATPIFDRLTDIPFGKVVDHA